MSSKKSALGLVVIAIIAGLLGGLLGGWLFARTGPQGEQGTQGEKGLQGEQGIQGIQGPQGPSGANGNNSVIQVIQSQNVTNAGLGAYADGQWYNMSVFDGSMKLTISVQNQSRICAEFLSSVSIPSEGTISVMIVVNNEFNSTVYSVGITNVPALTIVFPIQARILTNPLPSGTYTIEVQFQLNEGTPVLLGRSLYASEFASS